VTYFLRPRYSNISNRPIGVPSHVTEDSDSSDEPNFAFTYTPATDNAEMKNKNESFGPESVNDHPLYVISFSPLVAAVLLPPPSLRSTVSGFDTPSTSRSDSRISSAPPKKRKKAAAQKLDEVDKFLMQQLQKPADSHALFGKI
jgi:hypothetical protein